MHYAPCAPCVEPNLNDMSTYQGSITCIVTSIVTSKSGILSNNGTIFGGWYAYTSPTVDGEFLADISESPGDPGQLRARIFIPGLLKGGTSEVLGSFENQGHPSMRVADGKIVEFNWGPEWGPWALTISTKSFGVFGPDDARIHGVTLFSDPTEKSEIDSTEPRPLDVAAKRPSSTPEAGLKR